MEKRLDENKQEDLPSDSPKTEVNGSSISRRKALIYMLLALEFSAAAILATKMVFDATGGDVVGYVQCTAEHSDEPFVDRMRECVREGVLKNALGHK